MRYKFFAVFVIRYGIHSAIFCVCFYRKLADGLFLESCRSVSKLYPDIQFSDMIIDNCSMQVFCRLCLFPCNMQYVFR